MNTQGAKLALTLATKQNPLISIRNPCIVQIFHCMHVMLRNVIYIFYCMRDTSFMMKLFEMVFILLPQAKYGFFKTSYSKK